MVHSERLYLKLERLHALFEERHREIFCKNLALLLFDDVLYKGLLLLLVSRFTNENKISDALVPRELFLRERVLGDETLSLDINNELRANSLLALDLNRAAHLLDDLLANGEPEPSSLLVARGILVQLVKVDEKLFAALFRHADTRVDYAELDAHEVLLAFNAILVELLVVRSVFDHVILLTD